MASSNAELESEVRDLTGHDEGVLSPSEFESVIQRSKNHIKIRRSLNETQTEWYSDDALEEALFWCSCLFSKVAAGELDSQAVSVAAIDVNTLYAKDNDQITTWYRNMEQAIKRVNPGTSYGITSPERRSYGSDDDEGGTGGLSL